MLCTKQCRRSGPSDFPIAAPIFACDSPPFRKDSISAACSSVSLCPDGKPFREIAHRIGVRKRQAILIRGFAETVQHRPWTGELGLAWLAMLCDPRKPGSFNAVLPQIDWILERRSVVAKPAQQRALRRRLDIWCQAAEGRWVEDTVSIFRIAAMATEVAHVTVRELDAE